MKFFVSIKLLNPRLGSGTQLEKPSIHSVQFGSEYTAYLGAKIWELIPENIKTPESAELVIFKYKIKIWVQEICSCRLCKIYVNQ